jgi:hypothetical protein
MTEGHKRGALQRGKGRTSAVNAKVRAALKAIRQEMAANNGIYPSNGGAVSLNEVARRSGISDTTLFAPKQRLLKKRLGKWLELLKESKTVGRVRVQRKLSERVADWKKLYDDIQHQFIEVELELQEKQAQLERLQALYEALLEQARTAPSNVSVLPTNSRVR